ncbi:MAG: Maf family protein [Candidatus Neomarinimicrobiota bacterium]|jgi:septum formation protein|nr:Maf family protein [Candidatus Neomarinimicrobiota bacterium]|tara:strand:+ start:268 stop:858 length:591 start_codon:yes stop_codon:yes gene_type:complete
MKLLNNLGKIILASKSPRREQILNKINLNFEIVPSNIDENFDAKLEPSRYVKLCAEKKANKVSLSYKNNYIIGADTIVVLNNKILGKPKDKTESHEMLKMLSGKTHKVFSGVSIQKYDKKINESFYCMTDVTLNILSDDLISYYIKKYKPFDKAGSYGIQDWFSSQVSSINGCYYNVMGLPLSGLFKRLVILANRK